MKYKFIALFLAFYFLSQNTTASGPLETEDDFPHLETLWKIVHDFNNSDRHLTDTDIPTPSQENLHPGEMRQKLINKMNAPLPSLESVLESEYGIEKVLFDYLSDGEQEIPTPLKEASIFRQTLHNIMDCHDCLENAHKALYDPVKFRGLLRLYPKEDFDVYWGAYKRIYGNFQSITETFYDILTAWYKAILTANSDSAPPAGAGHGAERYNTFWQETAQDFFETITDRMAKIQIQMIALCQNNSLNFGDFFDDSDSMVPKSTTIPNIIGHHLSKKPHLGESKHGMLDILRTLLTGRKTVSSCVWTGLFGTTVNMLSDYVDVLENQNKDLETTAITAIQRVGMTAETWEREKNAFYNPQNLFEQARRITRHLKNKDRRFQNRLKDGIFEKERYYRLWAHLERNNFYQNELSPLNDAFQQAVHVCRFTGQHLINTFNLFRFLNETIASEDTKKLIQKFPAIQNHFDDIKDFNGPVSHLTFDAIIRSKQNYQMMVYALKYIGKWDEFRSDPDLSPVPGH